MRLGTRTWIALAIALIASTARAQSLVDPPPTSRRPTDMLPGTAGAFTLADLQANTNGPQADYDMNGQGMNLLVMIGTPLACKSDGAVRAKRVSVGKSKGCLFSATQPGEPALMLNWGMGKYSVTMTLASLVATEQYAKSALAQAAEGVAVWDVFVLDPKSLATPEFALNRRAVDAAQAKLDRKLAADDRAEPELAQVRANFRRMEHEADWYTP